MQRNRLIPLAAALLLAAFAPGCLVPEGENSINQEVAYVRRRAYEEWKAARERGEEQSARADGPLSLDDAIKLALQYNKGLQAAVMQREVARGNRMSSYAVILPSFTATAGASRVENFHRPPTRENLDSYSFGLSVDQPIWNGGRIPAVLRSSQLNVALVDEGIRAYVQDLVQKVANLYYDVLLAQHMVETQREALASAEAQLRMVTEKKKQETATDYDVLRAQVDVATYTAGMISQQNAIDTGRVALLKEMGVSQDSELTFSDKLAFLPMRPVFERAVEIASGNRADLRQAEITARVAQEAIRIANSAFFPSVAASAKQDWGGSFTGGQTDRNPWTVGLSAGMSFGIDSLGERRATLAEARQAEIDILDAQERTLQEIRREMNNLTNAEEMVKALEVNQSAAREALRLVLVGYQAGVRTEVDVTDARKALTEVQGQYYSSLADHTKARLNLQVAMGVLGPCAVSDGAQMPPLVPIANIEEFAAPDSVAPKPAPAPAPAALSPPPKRRRSASAPAPAPAARARTAPAVPVASSASEEPVAMQVIRSDR